MRYTTFSLVLLAAMASVTTVSAMAFEVVSTKSKFVQTVDGKKLTRLGIQLDVSPQGSINGNALGWDVNGTWSWDGGFFCRQLFWGGDDIGSNCQQVSVQGNKIRFTSDKGTGDSADFRLR